MVGNIREQSVRECSCKVLLAAMAHESRQRMTVISKRVRNRVEHVGLQSDNYRNFSQPHNVLGYDLRVIG